MSNNITTRSFLSNGILYENVVSFVITGIDRNDKRFKIESDNWFYINCINVWKGQLWLLFDTGKRKLIKRYN